MVGRADTYRFIAACRNGERPTDFDPATAIDADEGLIHFASRPSLNFDMLSINIGGQPDLDIIPGARQYAIPVKPISTFQTRLENCLMAPPREDCHHWRWCCRM